MTETMKDEVWILADGRAGNCSQAIGLAAEFGLNHKIVNISYGFFAFLPNLILRSSLLSLDKKTRQKLNSLNYLPKVVISAGRRSAPIALYLKNKSHQVTKIVQIMNPNSNLDKFDFVILPQHDRLKKISNNIIRSLGALTKVNDDAIKIECEKYKTWFENDTKKKIAVFVGGDTKKTKFSVSFGRKLAKRVAFVAKNMDAKIYVLTSRRTSGQLSEAIKSKLEKKGCDFDFFDFSKMKGENPYLAIVGFADFFIVTADSVSMISESCSTGKPVYVFDEGEISTKKHKNFLNSLLLENYVRLLKNDVEILENFSPKKLNETKRIASIINNALKLK